MTIIFAGKLGNTKVEENNTEAGKEVKEGTNDEKNIEMKEDLPPLPPGSPPKAPPPPEISALPKIGTSILCIFRFSNNHHMNVY